MEVFQLTGSPSPATPVRERPAAKAQRESEDHQNERGRRRRRAVEGLQVSTEHDRDELVLASSGVPFVLAKQSRLQQLQLVHGVAPLTGTEMWRPYSAPTPATLPASAGAAAPPTTWR